MDNEQIKEELKNKISVYLTSRGVNIKQAFKCLAGTHPDNRPSMTYWADKKVVRCHQCGKIMDIFDLIGQEYNLSNFNDKFKKACELYGYTPSNIGKSNKTKTTATATKTTSVKETSVNETVKEKEVVKEDVLIEDERTDYTEYFNSLPLATSSNCSYLIDRGLTDDTISHFKLRLDRNFRKLGNLPAVIIPLDSYSYCARNIDTKASKENRYRFSKGEKGIFNINALKGDKPVFITEGEIDSLSVIQASEGLADSICLSGAMSQSKLISYIKDNNIMPKYPLILNFDNDETGYNSLEKLALSLDEINIPYICYFVQGEMHDINEALQQDPEELKRLTKEAVIESIGDKFKKANILCASDYVNDFNSTIRDNVSTACIPTGYTNLDRVLDGGLFEGLYTIGAESSLGKTTFCLQMADQIAKTGRDVVIFSLEMSKYELMAKSISRETSLRTNIEPYKKSSRNIMHYKQYASYNQAELDLIEESTNAYREFSKHLYINEGLGDIGVVRIQEMLKALFDFKKFIYPEGYKPVIIIDYLQILAPYDNKLNDKQNIDKSILELKRLSRDYKIPIILISSLNRASYNNHSKTISDVSMADFKESGAIEYSSDVLLGLQLKLDENATKKDVLAMIKKPIREMELLVLKNRNGERGQKLNYNYYTKFNQFKELS